MPRLSLALGVAVVALLFLESCGARTQVTPPPSPRDADMGDACSTGCAPTRRCPEGAVYIAAGTFRMGSNNLVFPDEAPVHDVTLDAFCMDTLEVSAGMYLEGRKLCKHACDRPPVPARDDPTLPVVGIKTKAASAFCRSIGGRLPTEAEWEYAARGVEGRTFPWGEAPPSHARLAWAGADAPTGFAPVGSFPLGATPEGVLDLAGNASEWVSDLHGPYPSEPVTNPTGALAVSPDQDTAVSRGGDAFSWDVSRISTTRRDKILLGGWGGSFGFRCVYVPTL